MRRTAVVAGLGLAALVLTAPGCLGLGGGEPVAVREWDLLPEGPTPPTSARVEGLPRVQLPPFTVDPVLDRDALVWRRGEVEVGAYSGQRWARPPQEAAREVLAAALRRATDGALAVVTSPPATDPHYVLAGHLARCEEVDRGARWYGVVEVRVVLARPDGVELLHRTYRAEAPAHPRNPAGVVAALRRALNEVGLALGQDAAAALGVGGAAGK